jgi:two-component system, OmpR family, sensor kinase
VIRSQADRLERLVEDLLILARFDSGLELEARDVQLERLVAEHAEELALAAPERDVRLSAAEPATVRGSEERLRQVLANLTSNALRHTAPGGLVELGVTVDERTAIVSLRDDGDGIAEADLPYIFERFYRGDPARGSGGSGLGLAIVREIVEAHDGSVDVSSRPGAGSTFTVRLPLVAAGAAVPEAAAERVR